MGETLSAWITDDNDGLVWYDEGDAENYWEFVSSEDYEDVNDFFELDGPGGDD